MIRILILSCILIAQGISNLVQTHLDFAEYCLYHGHPAETHIVHTKDGYNLKYFRVQAVNQTIKPRNKVVYLQHGLEDSADTWVLNEQDKAPAFILANKGYDVWVGNIRGNRYSNPELSPNVKNFWDFSFDDMIKYDLPAAFQYINSVTNQKINYIGHSQGAMIMFGALSQKNPIVSSLLESFSAIGPGPYATHHDSVFFKVLFGTPLLSILDSFQVKSFLYEGAWLRSTLALVCRYFPSVCGGILQLQSEKDNSVNNMERASNYFARFPSGTSIKNLQHFKQIMKADNFLKFDYGEKKNLELYGTKTPPLYNMSKIEYPVHLFVGNLDRLITLTDAERLHRELGSNVKSYQILKFGHMTFVWGKDMQYVERLADVIQSRRIEVQIQNI